MSSSKPTTSVPKGIVKSKVPETVLKRRKAYATGKARIAALSAKRQKDKKRKRKVILKRADSYIKEYREMEREKIRLRRAAKSSNKLYVEAEPKLAFVIRIKGINKIPPKPRKVLQLLRLIQINNGVFVRLTKATLEMLKLVEPYVAY
ncbi:60S ribosomal protein L7, partial [Coelomomyces lativittatus]